MTTTYFLTIRPQMKTIVLSSALAIGTGASLLAISPRAAATENVRFTYNAVEVTISEDEVERFAETGELPDNLSAFFDETPQIPDDVRTLLTREFRIPRFVDSFLESPTGEFALLQIDQAINSSSNQGDLDSLRTAFEVAGEDRDVSFLELLKVYPEDEVSVNLTNLESVYNRTATFVEQIQPAIETAIGFLQDIVCECDPEQPAAAETLPDEAETLPDEAEPSSDEAGSSAELSRSNCYGGRATEASLDSDHDVVTDEDAADHNLAPATEQATVEDEQTPNP